MPAWQGGCRICQQREKVRQREASRSWLQEKVETERVKQSLYLLTSCPCLKSRQLKKVWISELTNSISLSLQWGPFSAQYINTQSVLAHPNTSNYTSPQGSSSKRDLCLHVTVHACVTLWVGGCTCVFIKKSTSYFGLWLTTAHTLPCLVLISHGPKRSRRGKSATAGEASEQEKDKDERRGGWRGRCICHQGLW